MLLPDNAITININSTNENTSIKADFPCKRLNLREDFLIFLKISGKLSGIF